MYLPEEGKKGRDQILSEKALLRLFTIRKNADFWKSVYLIQSIIPCEISKIQKQFKFSFKILSENKQESLEPIQFECYKVFLKICFYIDTMYNYEIEKAN